MDDAYTWLKRLAVSCLNLSTTYSHPFGVDDDFMSSNDKGDNFHEFQDCLSAIIIDRLSSTDGKASKKKRSRGRKNPSKVTIAALEDNAIEAARESDSTELSEFVEVLCMR